MYNFEVMKLVYDYNNLSKDVKDWLCRYITDFHNDNRRTFEENEFKLESGSFIFIDETSRVWMSDDSGSKNTRFNLLPSLLVKNALPCRSSTGIDSVIKGNDGKLHFIDFKLSETADNSVIYLGPKSLRKLSSKNQMKFSSINLSSFGAAFSIYSNNLDDKTDDIMLFVYAPNPFLITGTNKPLLLYRGYIKGDVVYELLKEKFNRTSKEQSTLFISYKEFLEYGDRNYMMKTFDFYDEKEYGIENWLEVSKNVSPTRDELIANMMSSANVDEKIQEYLKELKILKR